MLGLLTSLSEELTYSSQRPLLNLVFSVTCTDWMAEEFILLNTPHLLYLTVTAVRLLVINDGS